MAKSDKADKPTRETITRNAMVTKLLTEHKGQTFKVTFRRTKSDNAVRVMQASFNIAKGRKGGTGSNSLAKNGCLVVRDFQLARKYGAESGKDIRSIPVDGIMRVILNHVEYTVTD